MSRGPGWLQQAILDHLAGDRVHVGDLLWQLALEYEKVEPDRASDFGEEPIDRPFYQGFRRGIRRLEEAGRVTIELRKLDSLDEVIRFYPTKTRDAYLRWFRAGVLPHLADLARYEYGYADNEEHVAASLSHDCRHALAVAWQECRAALDDHAPLGTVGFRRLELPLLARGEQLCVPRSPLRYRRSFKETIDALRPELPPPVTAKLDALYSEFFPDTVMGPVALKSRLYSIGNFGKGSGGRSSIKDEVKEKLLRAEPGVIKGLPGHKEPTPHPRTGTFELGWSTPREFSPLLDRLVERDVFGVFEFIRAR